MKIGFARQVVQQPLQDKLYLDAKAVIRKSRKQERTNKTHGRKIAKRG